MNRATQRLIDPEELPFTPEELYQAACQFLTQGQARQMADHLAAVAPQLLAARAKRRAAWRDAGIPNADAIPLHGWVYPDELLPVLSTLSLDAARRVQELQQRLAIRPEARPN